MIQSMQTVPEMRARFPRISASPAIGQRPAVAVGIANRNAGDQGLLRGRVSARIADAGAGLHPLEHRHPALQVHDRPQIHPAREIGGRERAVQGNAGADHVAERKVEAEGGCAVGDVHVPRREAFVPRLRHHPGKRFSLPGGEAAAIVVEFIRRGEVGDDALQLDVLHPFQFGKKRKRILTTYAEPSHPGIDLHVDLRLAEQSFPPHN